MPGERRALTNSTKNLKATNFEFASALKLKLYERTKAAFAQGLPLPPIPLLLRTGPDGAGLLGGGPPLRGGGPLFIGRGPLEEPRRQHMTASDTERHQK